MGEDLKRGKAGGGFVQPYSLVVALALATALSANLGIMPSFFVVAAFDKRQPEPQRCPVTNVKQATCVEDTSLDWYVAQLRCTSAIDSGCSARQKFASSWSSRRCPPKKLQPMTKSARHTTLLPRTMALSTGLMCQTLVPVKTMTRHRTTFQPLRHPPNHRIPSTSCRQ